MNYVLVDLNDKDARLSLENGRYTVGSDEADTIYFTEADKSQLSLTYADGYITLLNAKTPIWVDGLLVSKYPVDVYPLDVVSLNEKTHFTILENLDDLPAAPELEALEKPSIRDVIVGNTRAIAIGATAIMILAGAGIVTQQLSKPRVEPRMPVETVSRTALTQDQVETFIKQATGARLVSVRFEDTTVFVHLVMEPGATIQLETLKADIARVCNQMANPPELVLVAIDLEEEAKAIQTKLKNESATRFLKASRVGREIKISGMVMPTAAAKAKAAIEEIKKAHPVVTIADESQINEQWNIKVVSVAISDKVAMATVKYNGAWYSISEGQNVFKLGKLKLITHKAIVIETPHGDIEVPI